MRTCRAYDMKTTIGDAGSFAACNGNGLTSDDSYLVAPQTSASDNVLRVLPLSTFFSSRSEVLDVRSLSKEVLSTTASDYLSDLGPPSTIDETYDTQDVVVPFRITDFVLGPRVRQDASILFVSGEKTDSELGPNLSVVAIGEDFRTVAAVRRDTSIRIRSIAPHHGNSNIVLCGAWNGTCSIWDINRPTETLFRTYGTGPIWSAAWDPSHESIFAAYGTEGSIYDCRMQGELYEFPGLSRPRCLYVKNKIFTVGYNNNNAVYNIWDTRNLHKPSSTVSHNTHTKSSWIVDTDPDSGFVMCVPKDAGKAFIKAFDVGTGTLNPFQGRMYFNDTERIRGCTRLPKSLMNSKDSNDVHHSAIVTPEGACVLFSIRDTSCVRGRCLEVPYIRTSLATSLEDLQIGTKVMVDIRDNAVLGSREYTTSSSRGTQYGGSSNAVTDLEHTKGGGWSLDENSRPAQTSGTSHQTSSQPMASNTGGRITSMAGGRITSNPGRITSNPGGITSNPGGITSNPGRITSNNGFMPEMLSKTPHVSEYQTSSIGPRDTNGEPSKTSVDAVSQGCTSTPSISPYSARPESRLPFSRITSGLSLGPMEEAEVLPSGVHRPTLGHGLETQTVTGASGASKIKKKKREALKRLFKKSGIQKESTDVVVGKTLWGDGTESVIVHHGDRLVLMESNGTSRFDLAKVYHLQ